MYMKQKTQTDQKVSPQLLYVTASCKCLKLAFEIQGNNIESIISGVMYIGQGS